MIYRGYVKSNNKGAIEPYKDVEKLRTLEEVKEFDSYGGVLADDTILIDVDSIEDSEKLLDLIEGEDLKCIVRYTNHGAHFLFKNHTPDLRNGTKLMLPIGIEVDVKFGYNPSFEPLKIKGKEREIGWDYPDYQEVPSYLLPLSKSTSRRVKTRFNEMRAGDGRNQSLFEYILTLQGEGLAKDDIKLTINMINKYILEQPLSQQEIDTITRDEAFKKQVFFKNKQLQVDKFSEYLKSEYHIKLINGQLGIYENGAYVLGRKLIEAKMVQKIPTIKRSMRQEVLSYIELTTLENHTSQDANFIAFKNGLYDIKNRKLVPYSPEHIITNILPWDYNPNAKSKLVVDTLMKIACNDKKIYDLLFEIIGYCLFRRNELGKFFILTGSGSNGKSTYLDIIRTALGLLNISSLDMSELNERFKTAEISGKLANIGDDISDGYINDTSIVKKLVTGEALTVERKGTDPFMFENYSKLLFSANSIPRLGKGSDTKALNRRMMIVPFNATFSKDDPDYQPYIKYDLRQQDAMEFVLYQGVQYLHKILEEKQFTVPEKAKQELAKYERENNPILNFFDDLEETDYLRQPVKEVYKKYTEYCYRNGLNPVSNISFSKQITTHFKLDSKSVRIKGKVTRIYTKVEES